MGKYDELVGRLHHHRVVLKSGDYNGAAVMASWCDGVTAATAITTLEAELAAAESDIVSLQGILSGYVNGDEYKAVLDELAAMKARGDRLAEALAAEPTEAMVEAGRECALEHTDDEIDVADIFRAMQAAYRPEPRHD